MDLYGQDFNMEIYMTDSIVKVKEKIEKVIGPSKVAWSLLAKTTDDMFMNSRVNKCNWYVMMRDRKGLFGSDTDDD